MSFGLGHGRALDAAEGVVGISSEELPALPDSVLEDPGSARLDPRGWFAEAGRRFEIEIGSGKGAFLVQQAELEPETNFLGIEWAGEFYAYCADRVRRRRQAGKLLNVRMLRADATEFFRWRVPDACAAVVHLYFSDPWPKKKHHKKRVIQHGMLADVWRVLEPEGQLRVVTDHDELWAWDEAFFDVWARDGALVVGAGGGLIPEVTRADLARMGDGAHEALNGRAAFERGAFTAPASAGEGELVGTNFERKFRLEGRGFNAAILKKVV